jgi:hypothetical protein
MVKILNQNYYTNDYPDPEILTNMIQLWSYKSITVQKAIRLIKYLESINNNNNQLRNVIGILKLYTTGEETIDENYIYQNEDYLFICHSQDIKDRLIKYDEQQRQIIEHRRKYETDQLDTEIKLMNCISQNWESIFVTINKKNKKNYLQYHELISEINIILGEQEYEKKVKKSLFDYINQHIDPIIQDECIYSYSIYLDELQSIRINIQYYYNKEPIENFVMRISDTLQASQSIINHIGDYSNDIKDALDYSKYLVITNNTINKE